MRYAVDVTTNGQNDVDRRSVSLNKSSVVRALGCAPTEIYVKLFHAATATLLVEGLSRLNTSGRYYLKGTALPLGYPLRSSTEYRAELTVGVPREVLNEVIQERLPNVDLPLGSRYCYVGIARNGRVKLGRTDDLDGTLSRHESDAMELFQYHAAWELNEDARRQQLAEKAEAAAKEHFASRRIGTRREWLRPGTPIGLVVDFFDERLRLIARPIEFNVRRAG